MANHTKQDLATTLKALLQEKPLEKISVSELTARCSVSRMTFYYHFKDMYDLVEWMCREDLKKIVRMPRNGAAWQECFTRIFQAIYAQKVCVENINRSVDRASVEKFWIEQINILLPEVVRSVAARVDVAITEEDIAFISGFYRYSFLGVLMEWFDRGMRHDYEETVVGLSKIMDGSIEQAVRNFAHTIPTAT